MQNSKNKVVYVYTDIEGREVYRQTRIEEETGKRFYLETYRNGEWIKGLKDVEIVLYNLQSVIKAVKNSESIYFVEGEKDVETMKQKGLVATTIACGSNGKLPQDISDILEGAIVNVIPDNDKVGKEFALKIAKNLKKVKSIKILDLTKKWRNLEEKNDITDVFKMVGNDREVLKKLKELEKETSEYILEKDKLNIPTVKVENSKNEETEQQEYNVEIKGELYSYLIPTNFCISKKENILFENKDGVRRISHLPVIITNIIENLDTNEEKLEIAVKCNGNWKIGIFSKCEVYGNPIMLASFGIPINSNNSRIFIKYLSELEADNYNTIPRTKAVNKLGWRDNQFIPLSDNCNIKIDLDYKLDKWINAYTQKGTLEEWIEKINPYRKNNLFRFLLSCSLSAPLLNLLEHRIFAVYNWGNSRAGKTAALSGALSIWGNPSDLMVTFNTTAVGLERLAGFYNDLPLGIDEKQVNKSQADIEKLVYMLSSRYFKD